MAIDFGNTSTNFACGECGEREDGQYFKDTAAELRKRQRCHNCWYWLIRVEALNDPKEAPRFVRTEDGEHYQIADERKDGGSRGHGGRPFIVSFFDGRTVRTTNLWSQGKIPERFRGRLPPNATVKAEPLPPIDIDAFETPPWAAKAAAQALEAQSLDLEDVKGGKP